MSEHKNLSEALAAFQAEMPVVTKSKTAKVPTKAGGSYSYSYADLATVSEIAMPRLTAHGLSFTCAPRLTDAGHYELVGTLRHASGDAADGALPIKGGTPQELGSSITYARRYLLGAMTGIVTDDDDDGALASQQREERQQRRRGAPAPRPMSKRTQGQLFALFGQKGIPENQQLAGINYRVGGTYESRADVTEDDARLVIDYLKSLPDAEATTEATEGGED